MLNVSNKLFYAWSVALLSNLVNFISENGHAHTGCLILSHPQKQTHNKIQLRSLDATRLGWNASWVKPWSEGMDYLQI